ncbi:helix-hairpin-helix domain-containing protein [Actinomycetospora endophytica]|uniref:Helix-hairpin-helix domain-containing protein n=1 Tax=Actinomycetospora endophytica TaxID=2291215 RepID=A0ABS8PJA7_9PSEU|nr:helix-hairpin-helix domain-containing protein [Actinomycetospora endophytica]MCD2198022.1 helix-hairpin-helix domain-containing protein [Actinomycetospora endophytica]
MTAAAPTPSRGNWFTRGGWWFLVHVASLGILAAVPFTAAAVRSRRIGHAITAAGVLLATVLAFVLIGTSEHDAAGKVVGAQGNIGGTLIVVILLGGLVGLIVERQQIYGAGARPGPTTAQPAVTRALAARHRREEARRLVASDPLLARELRIGRPDLPREYDDGGLVDLNSAPAQVLASVCGLEPVQAARIVQARQAAGRFGAVDDVFSWTDLPVEIWDQVRDRGVVL